MGGIEKRWWKGLQTCTIVSRSYMAQLTAMFLGL